MSGSALIRTAIAVGLLTLAGCGGKENVQKVGVKGKIVDGNKPWTLEASSAKMPKLPPGVSQPPTAPGAPGGMIQLGFHPVDGGGDVTYANVDPSAGTFVVIVKPGRYKISLSMGSMMPGTTDPFGGKFTQDKTKIVRDVERENEQITIDISKPTG